MLTTKTLTGLTEIRWHGRGGQGAVTSAEVVAKAAIAEGKYGQAFPAFGPERRGAPVLAFDRVDTINPIRVRAEIRQPDVVIVLDPTLLRVIKVTTGLKEHGFLIINTKKSAEQIKAEVGGNWKIAVCDASSIARELLGVNIVNTTMLGAFLKAVPVVSMQSMVEPLEERFGKMAERNFNALKRAYDITVVKE
jgi:pyruvate ferredoxin oxidoreductase gamma subunit